MKKSVFALFIMVLLFSCNSDDKRLEPVDFRIEVNTNILEVFNLSKRTDFNKNDLTATTFGSFSTYKNASFPFKDITFTQPLAIYKDNYICAVEPYRLCQEDIDDINNKYNLKISEDSNPLIFFLKINK